MEFALLGTGDIKAQLDAAYWKNVQQYNDNVKKNRYVLSKIVNCIKFCGAFELALQEQNETENPDDVFRGIVNFSAELDSTLSEHLHKTSEFAGIYIIIA